MDYARLPENEDGLRTLPQERASVREKPTPLPKLTMLAVCGIRSVEVRERLCCANELFQYLSTPYPSLSSSM